MNSVLNRSLREIMLSNITLKKLKKSLINDLESWLHLYQLQELY